MNLVFDHSADTLIVSSRNTELLRLDRYPLLELKAQLKEWLSTVTEENSECFIFNPKTETHVGTFRIEPRENGWQFTSTKEKIRSKELLALSEWKSLISNIL